MEAKDSDGVAPVFDLYPMIEMIDWANAAREVKNTCGVKGLRQVYDRRVSRYGRNDSVQKVIRSMENLSAALLTCRSLQNQDEGKSIAKALDEFQTQSTAFRAGSTSNINGLTSAFPHLLNGFVDQFKDVIGGTTHEGKLYHLACWYKNNGMPLQATLALLEAFIVKYGYDLNRWHHMTLKSFRGTFET